MRVFTSASFWVGPRIVWPIATRISSTPTRINKRFFPQREKLFAFRNSRIGDLSIGAENGGQTRYRECCCNYIRKLSKSCAPSVSHIGPKFAAEGDFQDGPRGRRSNVETALTWSGWGFLGAMFGALSGQFGGYVLEDFNRMWDTTIAWHLGVDFNISLCIICKA